MTEYLSEANSSIKQINMAGWDIETTGRKNDFLMGSIVGDNTWDSKPEVYWDKHEMLENLLSKRFRNTYLYATNLEFDLMGVLDPEWLDRNGYDFEMFHNGANIIYARIYDGNDHMWSFRDTYNIAPYFSVRDMGNIIGTPKLDNDLGIDFQSNDATDYEPDVMEQYNVRDSRITYEFMDWFQNQLNDLGGNVHVTAAKTAMKFFQRNYLNGDYAIQQPHETVLEKCYNGYYGGRVSPLTKGKIEGPIYAFDVASLYPYCMREADFPDTNSLKYERDTEKSSYQTKEKRILNREGMAQVTVHCPTDKHIPILPYKTEDKLAFPKGTLKDVWLCHNEIRFALERGYELVNIGEQIWSKKSFNPFKDYVEDLFDKRLEYRAENNATEIIVKLLMNSLYGKFGQKMDNEDGGVFEPITQKSFDEIAGKTVINGWVIDDADDDDYLPSYINPLIASYVTSRGRMELYKWFETAQEMGGQVHYCDTDSIYTDVDLSPDDEKRLGEMDFEGEFDNLWVFGPKMYVCEKDGDYKQTMKGVPRDEMESMWQAIRQNENEIEYEKISGMREAIRAGNSPNEMIKRTRAVNIASPTKRVHKSDGNLVSETVRTDPPEISYAEDKPEILY